MRHTLLGCAALLTFVSAASAQCAEELGKLVASDGFENDLFGAEVSFSGDTVAISARAHGHGGGDDSGVVYVFVRDNSTWAEQAELFGSDVEPSDEFVPLALDGDVLVVGAPRDDDKGIDSGAAYVFVRDGTTWSEEAKLVPADLVSGDYFGTSVSVSGDTIVVGAPGDNDGEVDAGSVYAFTQSGGSWIQEAKIHASDAQYGDRLGDAVSLCGNTAAIGTRGESVYVFTRSGAVWSEQAILKASDGQAFDWFGQRVSLDSDTIVVGAYRAGAAGAAYVFVRNGTVWTEQSKLLAAGLGNNDNFGYGVSVYGDAAVVGAPRHANSKGVAFLFERQRTAWTAVAKIAASDGVVNGGFGAAVALSGDTIMAGCAGDDDLGSRSGSLYLNRFVPGPETYCTAKVNSCGMLPTMSWSGQPSASASAGFVVEASSAHANKLGLLIYTDRGRASIPFQGGFLCIDTPIRRGPPTHSGNRAGACQATFALDMNCFARGSCGGAPQPFLLIPGTRVHCQWWGRDTLANGSLLSDGLEYVVCM